MIVKESEANTKKCPFMDGNCVGSECMGWRWTTTEDPADKLTGNTYFDMRPRRRIKTDSGYCGRSGG